MMPLKKTPMIPLYPPPLGTLGKIKVWLYKWCMERIFWLLWCQLTSDFSATCSSVILWVSCSLVRVDITHLSVVTYLLCDFYHSYLNTSGPNRLAFPASLHLAGTCSQSPSCKRWASGDTFFSSSDSALNSYSSLKRLRWVRILALNLLITMTTTYHIADFTFPHTTFQTKKPNHLRINVNKTLI